MHIEFYRRALSMQTHLAPLQQRVIDVVSANLPGFDAKRTAICASFARDLRVDALDKIEFVVALEVAFGIYISDLEAERIDTVQDAVDHVFFALNRGPSSVTRRTRQPSLPSS
jgi:acyl carrier protein